MKPFRLLIGTNNPKKKKELAAILGALPVELLIPSELGRFPEPVESGDTFEANARIKAFYYAEKTGLPTLADDSGLVVDALGGQPGVHSSRYAGEEATDLANCEKLLGALAGVPDSERTARFTCTIVVVMHGEVQGVSTGTCEGTILRAMQGQGGFGHDPLFLYAPEGKSFGVLPPELKNKISHRANALAGIRPVLEKIIREAPPSD